MNVLILLLNHFPIQSLADIVHVRLIGGMIGGLAIGVLGGLLLSEMMGSAVEAMGFDDEMEEVEDF